MKTIQILILLAFTLIACKNDKKEESTLTNQELVAKATKIHEKVMVLDTHNDINLKNFTDSINYSQELNNQVNLPKMKKGGLDVSWFVVFTGQGELNEAGYDKSYKKALTMFNAIHKLTNEIAPNEIGLAVSSNEARNLYNSGKKVAMIGIENGYPIGTDPRRVKEFYDLGARYMSLSHNGHSQLCDSNTGEENNSWLHNGVSELGKEVISEMNKWGMMIDVSHPSKEAMRVMIELSKAPIIASHSSARALSNHSRNLDDEQLEWMKKNGGVVQAVAFKQYVNVEKNNIYSNAQKEILKEIAKEKSFEILPWSEVRELDDEKKQAYRTSYNEIRNLAKPQITELKNTIELVNVADFVDHIDYLVEKLGINHVGISSDFDGGGGVDGWNDASETLNVTIELVKRGYTENQIEKLWSGNLLRVLDEVQQVAISIQNS